MKLYIDEELAEIVDQEILLQISDGADRLGLECFVVGGFVSRPLRAPLCSLFCHSGPPFPLPVAGGCPRGAGGAGPRGPRGRRCRGHRDDADAVSAGAAHVRGLRRQALELLHLPFAEADPHGEPWVGAGGGGGLCQRCSRIFGKCRASVWA